MDKELFIMELLETISKTDAKIYKLISEMEEFCEGLGNDIRLCETKCPFGKGYEGTDICLFTDVKYVHHVLTHKYI